MQQGKELLSALNCNEGHNIWEKRELRNHSGKNFDPNKCNEIQYPTKSYFLEKLVVL